MVIFHSYVCLPEGISPHRTFVILCLYLRKTHFADRTCARNILRHLVRSQERSMMTPWRLPSQTFGMGGIMWDLMVSDPQNIPKSSKVRHVKKLKNPRNQWFGGTPILRDTIKRYKTPVTGRLLLYFFSCSQWEIHRFEDFRCHGQKMDWISD